MTIITLTRKTKDGRYVYGVNVNGKAVVKNTLNGSGAEQYVKDLFHRTPDRAKLIFHDLDTGCASTIRSVSSFDKDRVFPGPVDLHVLKFDLDPET